MKKTIFSLVVLVLSTVTSLFAQSGNQFNLTVDNGMTSNHIYGTIVDKHGYLWIATPNGVLRYNGYELKTFTTEDGLPINDVWQLLEDAKGRIWLGSIANKIGYIYNEKYYNATLAVNNSHVLYPSFMKLKEGHINFLSNYSSESMHAYYFIEKNDTLYNYLLTGELSKKTKDLKLQGKDIESISAMINNDGKLIVIYKNDIFHYNFVKNKLIIEKIVHVRNNDNFNFYLGANFSSFIDKFIIINHYKYEHSFYAINIYSGEKKQIDLSSIGVTEDIISIYINNSSNDKKIYVYTQNYIIVYSVNGVVTFENCKHIKNELNSITLNGRLLTSYMEDPLWKLLLGSTTEGLSMRYNNERSFTKLDNIKLTGYKYLNGQDDHFFWINDSNYLLSINKNLNARYQHLINEENSFYKVIRKDKNNFYLLGKSNYIYNLQTSKATKLSDNSLGVSLISMITDIGNSCYIIGNNGFYTLNSDSGIKTRNYIDYDRYRDLTYDSLRKTYWAYNQNKIITYRDKIKTTYLQQQLQKFGVERAEKICIDNTYGNVFFKGNETLTMYDPETGKYQKLLTELNLKESNISIYKNILVIYGRSGVLFCKILGKQKISAPIFSPNIKNSLYKFIYDVQISFDKVIINTNNGVYSLDVPISDSIYNNSTSMKIPYRFVCYHGNEVINIEDKDTILIDPKDLKLRFDLINPYGNGTVKYAILNGQKVNELNGNEYLIPHELQSPDKYYKINITANDKIWRSKPISVYIYIKPYWWQTQTMSRVVFISSIFFTILLFASSILITRKLVLKAAQKKNMRMEMELKAIYAQINPHFIFNSLNSALLLVSKNKVDEAYTHILKFSRLLRSYIKSSRNKLISINEEVNNLKNYIELQQVRFKDKFEYEIIIDEQIEVNTINIPSLLLQPFVENAIEHGLLHKNESGRLKIEFKYERSTKKLLCIIDDDGIGRKESKLIKTPNPNKDESYGELLIKDLVNIFNKYENMNIHIDYFDKDAPLSGTIVTIKIDLT